MDKEMIHFSTYDCARSIPNMVDGLKISLRKILFAAFKRRLTSEIKVAQFSGYVSEHSAYHHGEASLNGAIVNMAQNYVGSNNVNLLEPNGQFGTRLHGGDDSASERYIFTMLNPLTRSVFKDADDAVLTYLNDDGTLVEPEYYVPIIPFALMNGISGIGTGFSCSIPAFSPVQIIDYLRFKLRSKNVAAAGEFVPYYEGFKGSVSKLPDNAQKYLVRGVYEKVGDDKIRITELPVGTWTMPYTTFLEGLMDGGTDKYGKRVPPSIRDFTSVCTEVMVDIVVAFPRGRLVELEASRDAVTGINGVEKLLKLSTTVSTTNMHMFNNECKLHKYTSVEEVIEEFYGVRLATYGKRKAFLIDDLQKKLVKLSNRAKYILATLDGSVDLRKKKADVVTQLLTSKDFALIDGDFKYLIKMPMDSVTEENVERIVKEKGDAEAELKRLQATSLETMWVTELDELQKDYTVYKKKRERIQAGIGEKKSAVKKVAKKCVVKKP
jgi:DNA topoisomerase-2